MASNLGRGQQAADALAQLSVVGRHGEGPHRHTQGARLVARAQLDLGRVDRVQRAELVGRGLVRPGLFVDLGLDPPDRVAVALGQKGLRTHQLVVRIEHVCVHGPALGVERRRKARLTPVEPARNAAEFQKGAKAGDRDDLDGVLTG